MRLILYMCGSKTSNVYMNAGISIKKKNYLVKIVWFENLETMAQKSNKSASTSTVFMLLEYFDVLNF